MTEWKTIDTAPKDGRFIICRSTRKDRVFIFSACYVYEDERFEIVEGWYDDLDHLANPEHWMPLPDM